MNIKSFVITLVVVLIGIVLIQNTEIAEIKFLFWQVQMSRIILFLLLLLVGIIIGFFIGFMMNKKNN